MNNRLILAVDNSEDDLLLLRAAFGKTVPSLSLRTLESGEEAISYIAGSGKYEDRQAHPLPRLILLDLKMPRVDGFQVLEMVRSRFPAGEPFVVVLSSSKLQEDIDRANALGATAFHMKPISFNELCELVQSLACSFCPPASQPPT